MKIPPFKSDVLYDMSVDKEQGEANVRGESHIFCNPPSECQFPYAGKGVLSSEGYRRVF